MNVFVILLMALFMAGYYFMDAPHLSAPGESKAEAIELAELKSVLACLLRAHSDALLLDKTAAQGEKAVFATTIPCAEKYDIRTQKLCSDDRRMVDSCVPDKADKTISNYIITTTDVISENGAGKTLEILAKDYPYAANFGIITIEDRVPYMISSGGAKREISRVIAKDAAFAEGQLAYITQYAVSGQKNPVIVNQTSKIKCNAGEIAVLRREAWTCVPMSVQKICSGDYIWDSEVGECVADNSRKPICQGNTSAIMVDGVWDCVSPEGPRECPKGMTAELDYEKMEWNCVENFAEQKQDEVKKCDKVYDRVYGGGTTALRGSLVSCNDCEKMIVHDDCTAECVPDADAVWKKSCYAGACRDFYFGFPDTKYIANAVKNIPQLGAVSIPLTTSLSRNRKFNCIECPFGIDELASLPPYVIICRK